MAMTYATLTGAKGATGAILTWVNYSKLSIDVGTIVDEAQALLYGLGLRTREMRTEFNFSIPVGGSLIALPSRFLDPIGRIFMTSVNSWVRHKDQSFIKENRNYQETSGTLNTNPFATTNNSTVVTVNLPGHGFNQDSVFNTSGATAFNGVTINGTFPITAIVDANDFTIDITILGATPNAGGSGGGAAVAYLCDNLVPGFPNWFGIWNETIYFDTAFLQQTLCKLHYYQSLPLLSASNQTNFLTNRYPQLLRRACLAQAADWMKDTEEYQKHVTALSGLIEQISIENDMSMRGMEHDTDTP
jgi:hypothetical protein